ncbi:hypothetical protein VTN77DRAFT_7922 [Rasamsonia byssochlamydoides]|uniref:uncharacterized protein n=1 Tax=Rasamsonia byssochlamydoides TaxID=89139 RepID=UPI003743B185
MKSIWILEEQNESKRCRIPATIYKAYNSPSLMGLKTSCLGQDSTAARQDLPHRVTAAAGRREGCNVPLAARVVTPFNSGRCGTCLEGGFILAETFRARSRSGDRPWIGRTGSALGRNLGGDCLETNHRLAITQTSSWLSSQKRSASIVLCPAAEGAARGRITSQLWFELSGCYQCPWKRRALSDRALDVVLEHVRSPEVGCHVRLLRVRRLGNYLGGRGYI